MNAPLPAAPGPHPAVEPHLRQLLDDPLVQLAMAGDGVKAHDLADLIARTRHRMIAERWRAARTEKAD